MLLSFTSPHFAHSLFRVIVYLIIISAASLIAGSPDTVKHAQSASELKQLHREDSKQTEEPQSPRSGERSPRPNSFSVTNILSDGPVKTTDIKSSEEVTGVKSPSPESWTVEIDTGDPLNWLNGNVPHTGHVIANEIAANGLLSGPISI